MVQKLVLYIYEQKLSGGIYAEFSIQRAIPAQPNFLTKTANDQQEMQCKNETIFTADHPTNLSIV
jgi:hypothetical protein